MATYTVTETIHHGNYQHTASHTGPNLYAALMLAVSTSPYYGNSDYRDVINAFTSLFEEFTRFVHLGGALVPSAEYGWSTYTLTITPDPED